MRSHPAESSFLTETNPNVLPFIAAAGLLMAVLSAAGLVFPDFFYSTRTELENFLVNDLVNLLLGTPLFLVGLIWSSRGKLPGFLLLPGALIYLAYNYIAYTLGQPLGWVTVLYLGLVFLAMFGLIRLLNRLDLPVIKAELQGKVREGFSGSVLVFFGLAFIALAVSQIWSGIQAGSIPPLGEDAVAVADILVSLGWVAGGIMLLRRHALGYGLGLGLLVAASALFLGLILYFFLAPVLVSRPFDWVEVITVLVMGTVAYLPTVLFWRGIIKFSS